MKRKISKNFQKLSSPETVTVSLWYVLLFFIGVCITALIVYKNASSKQVQYDKGIELRKVEQGYRYTDREQGFEVTFPHNWKSEKICNNGLSNDSYLCLQSPSLTVSPVPHVVSGELITIGPKGSGSFAATSTSLKVFCDSDDRIKIRSCEKTQYNGIPTVKKVWDSYPVIDVAILKENEIKYVIRLQYAYELLHSSHEFTDFETIVSSFKLIE